MTTISPEMNRHPVWDVLYQAALLEFNSNLLPQRVEEAKAAINAHRHSMQERQDLRENGRLLEALLELNHLLRMRTLII